MLVSSAAPPPGASCGTVECAPPRGGEGARAPRGAAVVGPGPAPFVGGVFDGHGADGRAAALYSVATLGRGVTVAAG